jgi:hypothetical protein
MIPFNPGNLLPFRTDRRFLRHKQAGTNRHPFGLRCPAARLMPFQLYIDGGASAVTWKLVDPADDTGATFTAMTAGDFQKAITAIAVPRMSLGKCRHTIILGRRRALSSRTPSC